MRGACSSTYSLFVTMLRRSDSEFIRGHCGLSDKKGIVGLCNRYRGSAVNPVSGLSLILLTLPGNAFPSGKRVLRHFIVFKENML